MKKHRGYIYENSSLGQWVGFSSDGKIGSKQNYEDLKRSLYNLYGRYSSVKNWDEYKQSTGLIRIFK